MPNIDQNLEYSFQAELFEASDDMSFQLSELEGLPGPTPVIKELLALNAILSDPALRSTQILQKSPALQTLSFMAFQKVMKEFEKLPFESYQVRLFQEAQAKIVSLYGKMLESGFSSPYMLQGRGGMASLSEPAGNPDFKREVLTLLEAMAPELGTEALTKAHAIFINGDTGLNIPTFSEDQTTALKTYLDAANSELTKSRLAAFMDNLASKRLVWSGDNPLTPPAQRPLTLDSAGASSRAASSLDQYDINVIVLTEYDNDGTTTAAAQALARKYPGKTVILDLEGNVVGADFPGVTEGAWSPPFHSRVKLQVLGHSRLAPMTGPGVEPMPFHTTQSACCLLFKNN